jgi:NDP-sugar pyrophosphorylase family protein
VEDSHGLGWYSSQAVLVPQMVDVLVLAGGRGSRLKRSEDRELRVRPKLLVDVNISGDEEPMLSMVVRGLSRYGFQYISLLTSEDRAAGGADIEAFALEFLAQDSAIRIFREPYTLGTAGAVYAASRYTQSPVAVVVPGDTLFPYNALLRGLQSYQSTSSDLMWFVTTNPGPSAQNAGRLLIDESSGLLVASYEGNRMEIVEPQRPLRRVTSAGSVIINTAAYAKWFESYVTSLERPTPIDLHRVFIPWLLFAGHAVNVFDIEVPAPDLGTPGRLHQFGRSRRV